MKKNLLSMLAALFLSVTTSAQVGINNTNPKGTLDITAEKTDGTTAEGIILPRLTGDQIKGKDTMYGTDQTGAIVYATSAVTTASAKTANITVAGYYYFDGSVWKLFCSGVKQQFYMPSIVLPTDPSSLPNSYYTYSSGTFTVDLHGIYRQQYETYPSVSSARNPAATTASTKLRTFDANKLDFFVTYFDNTVFQNVAVSDAGILTYSLAAGYTITEKTFMNIMFQEK